MTKNVFLNFSGESEELGKDIRSGIYANAALNDLCKQLGLSKKFSGFGVPANQDSHVVICDEIYPPSGAVFKNVDLAALKATQHLEV